MNYKKYIDLGFERTDLNDEIEFMETGYHGFCLQKTINESLTIYVYNGELNKPKLKIGKDDTDYETVLITPDAVIALVKNLTK